MLKFSDDFMNKLLTPRKEDMLRDELLVTISVITNIEFNTINNNTKGFNNYQLESLKKKMLTGLYEFNDALMHVQ